MEGGGRPSAVQAALLAASTAATALLYSVYRQKARVARGLEGARRVRLDGELRTVLLEAPGRCVPYAVIEGVVQSVKETLSSQFVENCKGVIQRLTLQEHKMVWNRTTHLWNDYEKMIHQRTNTAPFELVPLEEGAGGAVRVMKPLEAAELSLETVYEKFHPSVQSFTDVIGHYISGERPKGIQETEQMLKVGTALTGVGELVLDNATIKLQPPKQAIPAAAGAAAPPAAAAGVSPGPGAPRAGGGRPRTQKPLCHLPQQRQSLRLPGLRPPLFLPRVLLGSPRA
ncbi:mitochondrial ubiquitin ligase activator of NFKB 1 isoform X2 [Colius striatus]|uniref:mitochondrial ubiquitin ligase activator of NFKB 1 isoform X2 n=1 Tax=Colius striatus TaxID=57412 RepID=UPI002B1D5135|nr:mitochondrial ubiquitin ligase activator of NFKB 1 isoform X2 [Colius striatus]